MKRFMIGGVVLSLLTALVPLPSSAENFNPHYLVSDDEMTDVFSMSQPEIQQFLARGSLAGFRGPDIEGRQKTAAEIIYQESHRFGISPQFLMVLLQREQSLIQDPSPSQDQLDWAMGYAICDSCAKNDPRLQIFRGFGKQVHHAAKRIRESYLADLAERGETLTGLAPGKAAVIDGQTVIPMNKATAVLYTYTPHLHGNENFTRIWRKWFLKEYPSGSLLQNMDTGAVFLIKFGKKRPITSPTALYTRFDPNTIIPVKPAQLESYPEGAPISFPNYSLLRSPAGTVFLLVDDVLRGIVSMEAFRKIGFNPDEIVEVTDEDLSPYAEGAPITTATEHPTGMLMQNPLNGGIFYVENGQKAPIYSREVLDARFPGWTINPGNVETLESYQMAGGVKFADGTLIAVPGSPDVFVVADGMRRHITDETTFLSYGYQWNNIIWTNERAVLEHPYGEPLTLEIDEEDLLEDDIEITSH